MFNFRARMAWSEKFAKIKAPGRGLGKHTWCYSSRANLLPIHASVANTSKRTFEAQMWNFINSFIGVCAVCTIHKTTNMIEAK